MTPSTRGAWRPARAGALTVVTLVLAAGSHASAGGSLPPWWALLALAVPTVCAAFALTGRRPSTPITLVALGAAQLLLHLGFSALTAGCAPAGHHVVPACAAGPSDAAGHVAAHATGPGMLLAHVGATAVTGVLLARGEQALFALAERLAWTVPVLGATSVPVRPRLPRPVERTVRPRLVDAAVPVRRGPPVRVRATA